MSGYGSGSSGSSQVHPGQGTGGKRSSLRQEASSIHAPASASHRHRQRQSVQSAAPPEPLDDPLDAALSDPPLAEEIDEEPPLSEALDELLPEDDVLSDSDEADAKLLLASDGPPPELMLCEPPSEEPPPEEMVDSLDAALPPLELPAVELAEPLLPLGGLPDACDSLDALLGKPLLLGSDSLDAEPLPEGWLSLGPELLGALLLGSLSEGCDALLGRLGEPLETCDSLILSLRELLAMLSLTDDQDFAEPTLIA